MAQRLFMKSTFKKILLLLSLGLFLLSCNLTNPKPTAIPTIAPTRTAVATPTPPPTSTPATEVGASGIGDTYYATLGNGGYDVKSYTIILEVDPSENSLTGMVKIQATTTQDLRTFNLDLQGLDVDAVLVNEEVADFSRSGDELIITPAQPLESDTSLQVEVQYHGTPELRASEAVPFKIGWSHSDTGSINMWGEPVAASTWFPNNNHPRDKATYRFEITVPNPWIVAATGTLKETNKSGDKTTFVWEMDKPMATYLASINIDQYEMVTEDGPDDIIIRNYFPKEYPVAERKAYDVIPEMLDFLGDLFGPYPFDEYGVVVASQDGICEEVDLALETQTLSLHCPVMRFEGVIVHELAHQWFGDSISLENWQDVWLKEGFATYAEWLWESKNDPDIMSQIARDTQEKDFDTRYPVAEPSPNDIYSVESYWGGALVLQALREKVGDEVFFDILRTYSEKYRYSYAGTDEFIDVAQEVSGQDLTAFFKEWVYSTRLPKLPN